MLPHSSPAVKTVSAQLTRTGHTFNCLPHNWCLTCSAAVMVQESQHCCKQRRARQCLPPQTRLAHHTTCTTACKDCYSAPGNLNTVQLLAQQSGCTPNRCINKPTTCTIAESRMSCYSLMSGAHTSAGGNLRLHTFKVLLLRLLLLRLSRKDDALIILQLERLSCSHADGGLLAAACAHGPIWQPATGDTFAPVVVTHSCMKAIHRTGPRSGALTVQ